MAACNLANLQTSACDNGFDAVASNDTQWKAVVLQLLCELVNGGGGGGGSGVTCGDYSGGEPDFTPATDCALAIDTSTGDLWRYYSGAWH